MIALGLLLTFISPQTLLYDKAWKELNRNEVTHVHRGWYENIEKTFEKTSATGKGPLWAQVATAITSSKTRRGELMLGFKMKL